MTATRKALSLAVAGILMGAALAFSTPPDSLSAFSGCVCNDTGSGGYSCNAAQTGCLVGGTEKCTTTCTEE